jgi:hypothetical protein
MKIHGAATNGALMRPVTVAAVQVPIRRLHADALLGDAATPFPSGSTNAG